MSKQAFELLDLESGYKYSLETASDVLDNDYTLILPTKNGTVALIKDIEDLSSKLVRGDISVGDSDKLGNVEASKYALADMTNITLTTDIVNSLRGYTGSVGATGQGFVIGTVFNSLTELLEGSTTNDTFGLVGGTLDPDHVDYGKLYLYKDGLWSYITDMSVKGTEGITGPQGVIGYTGSQGYVGSQGITGYVGSTGVAGSVGYTGSQGIQGSVGVLETRYNLGVSNNLDLNLGNLFTKTITAATTFTVSNLKADGNTNSFILELTNGGVGIVTWFTGIKWAGGVAPTLTTSGVDILGFYSHNGGVTWRGMIMAKDSK